MYRNVLINILSTYHTPFQEEQNFIAKFLDLLTESNCFLRTNLDRHLTASAWIVNPELTKTLLIHHAKLHKWLQPGGHADGIEDLLYVAKKEVSEETGISEFLTVEPAIFDIDIHLIPQRKEVKEHHHYDIRFLMVIDENTSLFINHESKGIMWIPLVQLEKFVGQNRSILRMREKTKSLLLRSK